ncbi:endothelin-converting enzyme homolog [Rhopilema esculentum]|uniref:endothelin-converting enzyme homolog n=1 Tax=Rhopilema esculentum TaxID=499914 RepID=UPI0031D63634
MMRFFMRKVFFLVVLQLFSLGSLQISSGTHLEDPEDNSEDYLDELKRARPGFNNVDENGHLDSNSLFTVYEDDEPLSKEMEENDDEDKDYDKTDDVNIARGNHARKPLCLTKECVIAAAEILSTMNPSADPCHDFYDYVCGNIKLKEPFEDMTRTMSFETLRRQNNYILHTILKEMPTKNGSSAIDKVKRLYDSCIASEHNSADNIKALKKMVDDYGPWPLAQASKWTKNWSFQKKFNEISLQFGRSPLFSLSVTLDEKEPSSHTLQLQQAGLLLPRDYYISNDPTKSKVYQSYCMFMLNIMKLLGYNKSYQISMLKDVQDFERKLAKISIPATELRKADRMYKRVSIGGLMKLLPEIEWKKFIATYLELAGYKLSDAKYVVLYGQNYFRNLGILLRTTKKETLANYLLWNLVSGLYAFVGEKFRQEGFRFEKIFAGKKAEPSFWLFCTELVEKALPFAYGRMYVDARFRSKFAKREARRIVRELKQAFVSNLQTVSWMSDKTKEKAKEKAEAIKELIAYPDYILDDKKLNKKYKDLHINSHDFVGNILQVVTFNMKDNIRMLKKKRDRARWASSPSVVNAFYSQVYNRIVFPAGILQPLFYHHGYPSAMKYGGIGTVIGHEITHAFDDLGRKFDKYGRLVQWWNSKDIKAFEKEANCIRNQYSSYSIYGKHMNGKLSCGENIADNGGVKIAYQAFRKHLRNDPETKALPGLQHLSDDQLFYISFSKIWCDAEAKARTLKNIVTDHHSYPKFRVIGALSNSKEFSKAFRCRAGSRMNPAKKCIIW